MPTPAPGSTRYTFLYPFCQLLMKLGGVADEISLSNDAAAVAVADAKDLGSCILGLKNYVSAAHSGGSFGGWDHPSQVSSRSQIPR